MQKEFKKRILGNTGIEVTPFAIGGGYLASPTVLNRAFDAGINTYFYAPFFPTYLPMAAWLRSRFPKKRDKHILCTASYFWKLPGALDRTVHRHLKWLRAEYIDIFFLGWMKHTNHERAFDTLLELKEKKVIRHIGISVHTRSLAPEVMVKFPVEVVMTRYNIAHRGAERDIFPHVKNEGVVAFNALKHGKALGKPKGWKESDGAPATAGEAYRFVLSNDTVQICLAGPMKTAHVDELVSAMKEGPLEKKRMEELRKIGDALHG
jgi:aryl-alcohol dehydrogenase-like predicted oxidoreductase